MRKQSRAGADGQIRTGLVATIQITDTMTVMKRPLVFASRCPPPDNLASSSNPHGSTSVDCRTLRRLHVALSGVGLRGLALQLP